MYYNLHVYKDDKLWEEGNYWGFQNLLMVLGSYSPDKQNDWTSVKFTIDKIDKLPSDFPYT
jgi:hypothetical protein